MKIIKIYRGKEIVIEEGDRKKLTNRLKQLRSSTKGKSSGRGGQKNRVEYKLVD